MGWRASGEGRQIGCQGGSTCLYLINPKHRPRVSCLAEGDHPTTQPPPLLSHPSCCRNQCYTGFPSLNLVWQEMDSKALKRAYGMQEKQKGEKGEMCAWVCWCE